VRIARCGVESSTRLGRHRWKAERSIAWLAGCRRLRVRYDRDSERFFAFAMLAGDRLCYNRLPLRGHHPATVIPVADLTQPPRAPHAVGVCWAFTWDEPVCWAHPAAGRIHLQVPDVAGVLQDIHPGGREYLASAERDDDTVAAGAPAELTRRRYPDGALVERLAFPGMPPGAWTASYLTSQLLLVRTWSQRDQGNQQQLAEDLLVGQAPLRVLGRVGYPASQGRSGAILGCHDGAWLTLGDRVERWTLAKAPGDAVDHQPSCA
jgi:hypothetical protein